jgi:hypothetical protein
LRSFEIFKGTAREDNLVASVINFQEDYGKDVEAYKDYLLSRKNFLFDLSVSESVRIVNVPYDRQMFEQWLKENPYWKNNHQESESAWALDIAKNDEALLSLYAKHPVLPGSPDDEEITTNIFYAVIPILIENKESISLYSKQLLNNKLTEILHALKRYFREVPAFKQLSPTRCRGARFMIGNRLITPSSIEKAEHCIETKVESLLVSNDNPSQVAPRTGAWIETDGIFSIPRNIRIRTSDFDDSNESFITIALLPVIIVGSTGEIWYCETALHDRSAQENVDEISGQILNMINEVKDTGIEGKIIIVDGYEVAEIISEMYDDDEEYEDEFEGKHKNKNKTARNRNGLKRIK